MQDSNVIYIPPVRTRIHGADGRAYDRVGETCYSPDTPDEVIDALEFVRARKYVVRVFYGDTARADFETVHKRPPVVGRDWCEENDTIGHIGRSTGTVKIPLIVPVDDIGGPALLSDCIVKIMRAHGEVLYQHPEYSAGEFTIHPDKREFKNELRNGDALLLRYKFRVDRDGEEQARFKTKPEAQRYVDFMLGKRFRLEPAAQRDEEVAA